MKNQLCLFHRGMGPETEMQKYIRSFADAGHAARAEQLFRRELLKLVQAAGLCSSEEARAMAAFGQKLFGARAEPIIADCANAVAERALEDFDEVARRH